MCEARSGCMCIYKDTWGVAGPHNVAHEFTNRARSKYTHGTFLSGLSSCSSTIYTCRAYRDCHWTAL